MKLLSFELKKTLFSKRFLYLLLVVACSVLLLFARSYFSQSNITEERYTTLSEELQYGQSLLRQYQDSLTRNPDQHDVNELYKMIGPIVEDLSQLITEKESDDWKKQLLLEIDYLTKMTAFQAAGGQFPISAREIQERIVTNNHLLAKEIEPQHATYSLAMPNFMKQVVDLLATAGVVILVLVAMGDLLTLEFENRSIHFLFVQPLKKVNIIHAKVWSSIIAYFILIATILASTWLISSIFGTNGTFDYPILIEDAIGFAFLPLHQYIPALLTLTSMTALFIIGLTMWWSLFVKHTLAALFGILITLVTGYLLLPMLPIPLWLNPFQNLFPIQSLLDQTVNPWWATIPITLATFSILYVWSAFWISKVKLNS